MWGLVSFAFGAIDDEFQNDQLFSIIYLVRSDEEFVTQKLQQFKCIN